MPRTALKIPPGLWRNGTRYQSRGRWYDAALMRCTESTIRPMGGWTELEATGTSGTPKFLDTFTGGAGPLTTHPADSNSQVYDSTGYIALNGTGAAVETKTNTTTYVMVNQGELAAPAIGDEFYFEFTLPDASWYDIGKRGIVFLRSNAADTHLRLTVETAYPI
jgi:hypothetical protein